MPESAVINRASLSQQIRDALLERIATGVLKPGDRLVELKIAKEMATSQAPVREALRELEAIGLIEVKPNRGARVRIVDENELAEIYLVRAELEALAGEIVSVRAPGIADKLEQIVARMCKVADLEDAKNFALLNSEFHSTIITATGNETLIKTWESLNVRSLTRVRMSRGAADLRALSESHLEIATAISSGIASQAREVSWRHVRDNMPSDAS